MNMSSSSKIHKSGKTRDPRTQSEKSAIEYHNEHVKKLEVERAMLEQIKEQGMFTKEDENKISAIDIELKKYATAMA